MSWILAQLALPSRRDVRNRLEVLIGDYLAHRLSEGRRHNTVENAYGYRFATCSYRGARGRIDQPSQLTRRTMECYQGELLSTFP